MEDVELVENEVLFLSAAIACTSASYLPLMMISAHIITVFYFYFVVHDNLVTQIGQLDYFVYGP